MTTQVTIGNWAPIRLNYMSPSTFSLIYICIGYFSLFAVWSIFAHREGKLQTLLSFQSTAFTQSFLNLLHVLTGIFMPISIGPDILYRSFGLTIFTVGIVVAVWARFTMGKYWDVPGTFSTANGSNLIMSGPFAYSRNPIYLGIMFVSIGMAIALKSITFILVIFLYLHLYVKTREEEAKLQKHFGDAYTKYQLDVPRFI